MAVMYIYRC